MPRIACCASRNKAKSSALHRHPGKIPERRDCRKSSDLLRHGTQHRQSQPRRGQGRRQGDDYGIELWKQRLLTQYFFRTRPRRDVQNRERPQDFRNRPQWRTQRPGDAHRHHRIGRSFKDVFGEISVKAGSPFLTRHKVENGARGWASPCLPGKPYIRSRWVVRQAHPSTHTPRSSRKSPFGLLTYRLSAANAPSSCPSILHQCLHGTVVSCNALLGCYVGSNYARRHQHFQQ